MQSEQNDIGLVVIGDTFVTYDTFFRPGGLSFRLNYGPFITDHCDQPKELVPNRVKLGARRQVHAHQIISVIQYRCSGDDVIVAKFKFKNIYLTPTLDEMAICNVRTLCTQNAKMQASSLFTSDIMFLS